MKLKIFFFVVLLHNVAVKYNSQTASPTSHTDTWSRILLSWMTIGNNQLRRCVGTATYTYTQNAREDNDNVRRFSYRETGKKINSIF